LVGKIDAFLTKRPSQQLLFREEAGAAIKTGEEQLAVLHRQAILGQLYPSARSVMEKNYF